MGSTKYLEEVGVILRGDWPDGNCLMCKIHVSYDYQPEEIKHQNLKLDAFELAHHQFPLV